MVGGHISERGRKVCSRGSGGCLPTFGVGRECSCSTKILEGLSPAPSMKGLLSPTSVSLPGGWGGGGMAPAWFVSWGLLCGSEHLLLPPQLWPLSQPLISHATPFPTQPLCSASGYVQTCHCVCLSDPAPYMVRRVQGHGSPRVSGPTPSFHR